MKVFNISLPKTGTKSITMLFERLGLRSVHDVIEELVEFNNNPLKLYSTVEKMDGISGGLSPIYKELYNKYPEANYILITRDKDSWLNSCAEHFKKPTSAKHRILIFGIPDFDYKIFSDVYDTFHKDCKEFFKGKDNFFCGDLYDAELPRKVAEFIGIKYNGFSMDSIRDFKIYNDAKKKIENGQEVPTIINKRKY